MLPSHPHTRGHAPAALSAIAAAMVVVAGCASGMNDGRPPPIASARTYVTRDFVVPLSVDVTPGRSVEPAADLSHFLTWVGTGSAPAIRFMVPVRVYVPGAAAPSAVPVDFLSYLLSQTSAGAMFTDRSTASVDGRPTTLITATTSGPVLDGSLGCPDQTSPARQCFGLESSLVLRLAVISTRSGTTLLAWARVQAGRDDQSTAFASFEKMLASVRFR